MSTFDLIVSLLFLVAGAVVLGVSEGQANGTDVATSTTQFSSPASTTPHAINVTGGLSTTLSPNPTLLSSAAATTTALAPNSTTYYSTTPFGNFSTTKNPLEGTMSTSPMNSTSPTSSTSPMNSTSSMNSTSDMNSTSPMNSTSSTNSTSPMNNTSSSPQPSQSVQDQGQRFDLASFIGGMILAIGVLGLGIFLFKVYQSRRSEYSNI